MAWWLRPIGLAFAPGMAWWLRPIGLAFAPGMAWWLRPIGLAFAPLIPKKTRLRRARPAKAGARRGATLRAWDPQICRARHQGFFPFRLITAKKPEMSCLSVRALSKR